MLLIVESRKVICCATHYPIAGCYSSSVEGKVERGRLQKVLQFSVANCQADFLESLAPEGLARKADWQMALLPAAILSILHRYWEQRVVCAQPVIHHCQ